MTLSAVARSPGRSPPYQAAMTTAMVNETTGAKSPRVSETVCRTIATNAVAPIAIRYPCADCWNCLRIVVASRPGGAGATPAAGRSAYDACRQWYQGAIAPGVVLTSTAA